MASIWCQLVVVVVAHAERREPQTTEAPGGQSSGALWPRGGAAAAALRAGCRGKGQKRAAFVCGQRASADCRLEREFVSRFGPKRRSFRGQCDKFRPCSVALLWDGHLRDTRSIFWRPNAIGVPLQIGPAFGLEKREANFSN